MTAPGRVSAGVFLTLDVEAWFHHPGHPLGRDPSAWDALPWGLQEQMARAFELMARGGARATCFFLGSVARRFPALVREAVERGHEVASHGMDHAPVSGMTRAQFARDLRESKAILEETAGVPVLGFRAPAWSAAGVPWAREAMAECGYAYSSSRLPIPGLGGAGGIAEGPIPEVPGLTCPFRSAPFPAGGTVALRALPMTLLESCRDGAVAEGRPAVYWFHPWELDAGAPRLDGLSAPARFQRYGLLERLPERLLRLAGGARRTLAEAVGC